jgi:hypothetical protein
MPGIPRLNVFPEIRRTTREPPERHTNTSNAELSEDGSLYSWSDPIDSDSESHLLDENFSNANEWQTVTYKNQKNKNKDKSNVSTGKTTSKSDAITPSIQNNKKTNKNENPKKTTTQHALRVVPDPVSYRSFVDSFRATQADQYRAYKSDKELQQSFNTNSFKLELSTEEWMEIIEQKDFDKIPQEFTELNVPNGFPELFPFLNLYNKEYPPTDGQITKIEEFELATVKRKMLKEMSNTERRRHTENMNALPLSSQVAFYNSHFSNNPFQTNFKIVQSPLTYVPFNSELTNHGEPIPTENVIPCLQTTIYHHVIKETEKLKHQHEELEENVRDKKLEIETLQSEIQETRTQSNSNNEEERTSARIKLTDLSSLQLSLTQQLNTLNDQIYTLEEAERILSSFKGTQNKNLTLEIYSSDDFQTQDAQWLINYFNSAVIDAYGHDGKMMQDEVPFKFKAASPNFQGIIAVSFKTSYRNQSIWEKCFLSHFDPENPPTIIHSENVFWPEAKFPTTFLRPCKHAVLEKVLIIGLNLKTTPIKKSNRYTDQSVTILSNLPCCNMCHSLEHTRFKCPSNNCKICNSPNHKGPDCPHNKSSNARRNRVSNLNQTSVDINPPLPPLPAKKTVTQNVVVNSSQPPPQIGAKRHASPPITRRTRRQSVNWANLPPTNTTSSGLVPENNHISTDSTPMSSFDIPSSSQFISDSSQKSSTNQKDLKLSDVPEDTNLENNDTPPSREGDSQNNKSNSKSSQEYDDDNMQREGSQEEDQSNIDSDVPTQCDTQMDNDPIFVDQETIQNNNQLRATAQSNSDSTTGPPSNSNTNQNSLASQTTPQETTQFNQVGRTENATPHYSVEEDRQ